MSSCIEGSMRRAVICLFVSLVTLMVTETQSWAQTGSSGSPAGVSRQALPNDRAVDDAMDAYDRRDYQAALRLARPLANAGNPRAQYVMGLLHHFGRAVAQDHAEAARWYRLSAAQGNHFAQNNLGALYEQGLGVERNLSEARRLYYQANAAGFPHTEQNLARIQQLIVTNNNNSHYNEILTYAAIFLIFVAISFFGWKSYKLSKKCPKCNSEWSWEVVSSIDEPRSTFQKSERTGESRIGGDHAGYIYTVTTVEVGLRTEEFACKKCGHEATKRSSYQKSISSHSETR